MQKILFTTIAGLILIVVTGYLYFNPWQKSSEQTGIFSRSASNYPEAKRSEIVELKNGDSYNLTASIVKKK